MAAKKPAPSELLDRPMPQNIEAEKCVVGSIILDPALLSELSFLRASDFHNRTYGVIFQRIVSMKEQAIPIDSVTLSEHLRRHGELLSERESGKVLKGCATLADLAECMASVPVTAHAAYYGKLVAEASFRRRIIHSLVILLQRAYDLQVPVDVLRKSAAKLLDKIRASE